MPRRGVAAITLISALVISPCHTVGVVMLWPLSGSDEQIERQLRGITPLGVSLDDVEQTLDARNMRPSLGRERGRMTLSATLSPAWQKRWLPLRVHAVWYFDGNNDLDEIRIVRSFDGP